MKNIDLHKFALAVGFDVVCVDDDFTSYEFMERIESIESMSYVLQIKNEILYEDVDTILKSIMFVLPPKLKKKLTKLLKKKDETNIGSIIDLLCFSVEEYRAKCDYEKLREYASLLGIDLSAIGYYFTYKLTKQKYLEILSYIERNLTFEDSLVLGKMKKLDYKIGYLKQKKSVTSNEI